MSGIRIGEKEIIELQGGLWSTPSIWRSISSDIAIYYSEVLLKHYDSKLEWSLQTEKVMDYHFPALTSWKQLKDYKDGMGYYIFREIYALFGDNFEKEGFIAYRLSYHIEELL